MVLQLAVTSAETIRILSKVEKHDIAIILGSGWSFEGEVVSTIPANTIKGFHNTRIAGHKAEVQSVRLSNGKMVLVLPRTHLYEGYGVDVVAHPVRVAKHCGVETIILTNAAGSINGLKPGEISLISDHINLTGTTPLIRANFIDMSNLYSQRLRSLVQSIEPLPESVYAQFRGPQYETPAEIKMARIIGADLAGMSTGLEAITAREQDLEVIGLSLVTNYAAGINPIPLSHEEVLETGKQTQPRMHSLLTRICNAI